MPCNAWNHPADCNCGWGGMWHGNVPSGDARGSVGENWSDTQPKDRPLATSIHRLIEAKSPRSLTVPNAHCPVCGETVFFLSE